MSSTTDRSATIKEIKDKLAREEATSGRSGAVPNAPKASLFDASDLQAKKPDYRLRWLNLRNPEKVAGRIQEGYAFLEGSESRRLGDEYVLAQIPAEKQLERVERQKARLSALTDASRAQFEREVEQVAKVLRDKHGINVTPEHLMRV